MVSSTLASEHLRNIILSHPVLKVDFLKIISIDLVSIFLIAVVVFPIKFKILVVFFVIINSIIAYYIKTRPSRARLQRLKSLVPSPSHFEATVNPHLPFIPTASFSKPCRSSYHVSSALLIEGDTIQLKFGEITPANLKLVNSQIKLLGGVCFRPSMVQGLSPPYFFVLLNTPLSSLRVPVRESESFFIKTLNRIRVPYTFLVLLVSILSILHFMFYGSSENVASVVYPLLPLSGPVLYFIFRVFSNSHVHVLWNELQSATETFVENNEEDEFDLEAAPPMKKVAVHLNRVLNTVIRYFDLSTLVETLGSISTICFIDRCGTLTEEHMVPTKICFINQETVVVDVEVDLNSGNVEFKSDKLDEENDLCEFVPLLNPLAFSWIALSNCDQFQFLHKGLAVECPAIIKSTRSTCLCFLSRALGLFSPPYMYSKAHKLKVFEFATMDLRENDERDADFEIPFLNGVVINVNNKKQLFCQGPLDYLCDFTLETWDGKQLTPIQRNLIREWSQHEVLNDQVVMGYGYKPLESWDLTQKLISNNLVLQNQILLGIVSLALEPKDEISEFVEDMGAAGIRFVHFSSAKEHQTKVFGDKLGLETEWNSCILLSDGTDEHASGGYVQMTDIKARLPRGMQKIKEHLKTVDDIPLHVPLFAESSMQSITEMIQVFQEHGETVCCIGSTLNIQNTLLFGLSDVSIGVYPFKKTTMDKHDQPAKFNTETLVSCSKLIGSPCSLFMNTETSFHAVTQIIREARRLCRSGQQALYFLFCCSFCCSFVNFFIQFYRGIDMVVWVYVVSILLPLISLSFMFNPHENNTMCQFTTNGLMIRQTKFDFQATVFRQLCYLFLRTFFLGSTTIFVYLETNDVTAGSFFLIMCVFCSSTYLHRTSNLLEYRPNMVWVLTCLFVLFLQFLFILFKSGFIFTWYPIPGTIIQILINELIKYAERKEWQRNQRRCKLEFNTRLGMHSPI